MAILNRTSNYPPEVVHFENNFASYFNSKYGVSFCNATTCFEASIYALKLKKGDKVVVTGLTFYSFINNMLLKGIELIYMDIDDNLNINLEESLTLNFLATYQKMVQRIICKVTICVM